MVDVKVGESTQITRKEIRAAKDPEGLLREFRKMKFFGHNFLPIVVIAVFGVIALNDWLGALDNSLGSMLSAMCLVAAMIVAAIVVVRSGLAVADLARHGAELVECWYTLGLPPDSFPRTRYELDGYGDWLRDKLIILAQDATFAFDARAIAERVFEAAKKNSPRLPDWPADATPETMPMRRKNYEAAVEGILAAHEAEVAGLKERYVEALISATATFAVFTAWWNLVKDIGEFYEMNTLPKGDDGSPFNDPDAFRKYLREKSRRVEAEPSVPDLSESIF